MAKSEKITRKTSVKCALTSLKVVTNCLKDHNIKLLETDIEVLNKVRVELITKLTEGL